ncbi:methyltransferase domain-containing protein [Methylobacterium sp. BTF04]|uniref:class I SAM-dependent DNA methyltransferase n=1 Tax=Methylobacterium sp. BTF04 TaxID=2708300 RepID=UPI0013D7D253|nr:methyltransferase domain-containing protein [Methylobacterium sp. BTF04]NEU12345.1 methyltransferase domain-containing protein [Methylobacterium sp. BTF04]
MSRHHSSGDLLADRRYAYAVGCLADGDARGAAEMAEQTLEITPRYAPAWFLLGRAREARHLAGGPLADHHAALRAYSNALDLDPDDVLGARLALAQIGQGDALGAISQGYVRALFDGYAARFERHLVDDLHYRGPALILAALDAVPDAPATYGDVLDLGCGTGLVGAALGDRATRLVGIDLSPAMLAEAAKRRLYTRLVEGNLVGCLADEPEASADLAVAADVLIYVGSLATAFTGVARVLRPRGRFAFTVQSHDGDGLVLGADARYAHADTLVSEAVALAGLDLCSLTAAAVRRERGIDVPGRIVVASRPARPPPAI